MTEKALVEVLKPLLVSFNTARSLELLSYLESENGRAIAEMAIDPLDYVETDLEKFRNDYFCVEYLSKYTGLTTGIDTEQVALASFTAAEVSCSATNHRLLHSDEPLEARWQPVISRAQLLIQRVIGNRVKWTKLLDGFGWGPGATFSVKAGDARLDYKVTEKRISVTQQALPLLRAAMATDYAVLRARGLVVDGPTSLLNDEFDIVRGCRGTTVPKNAKTDRFIAIEPSGNVFLQKGFGAYFRHCLHRVGIDLDDQTVNQVLAKEALDRGLATVDLKAASDTISSAVVWLLLPYSWACALDRVRSPQIYFNNEEWKHLHKFSSMGNGFTFELETLIFWGLTRALTDLRCGTKEVVSVYGDDVICPTSVVPELAELFAYMGFTMNSKKTHYQSLFRESCGRHFFGGKDVTPIYQKDVPFGKKAVVESYSFHNRLFYHAVDRLGFSGTTLFADSAFRESIRRIRAMIEASPSRYGTGHHYIPLSREDRDLSGGLAVDVRDPNLRITYKNGHTLFTHKDDGGRAGLWVKSLAWCEDELKADETALFAASLRGSQTTVRLGQIYEIGLLKPDQVGPPERPRRLSPIPNTMLRALGTSRFPSSDGGKETCLVVTQRDRGRWKERNRRFLEACDLRWIA